MKRAGNLYKDMLTFTTQLEVFAGVMKGKKKKRDPGSQAFMIMNNKAYYMSETARMLAEKDYRLSKPKQFTRKDRGSGKERNIQAPRLWPDQFIHWSLIVAIRPVLMKGMDDHSYASIKSRGPFKLKKYLEKQLDDSLDDRKCKTQQIRFKHKYALKMDIKKYFENINRELLMDKLSRKIKDKEILELCSKIIYSVPGKGLPLGYFTSQWFANFYLQDLDHYIREKILPKYNAKIYCRYLDDLLILCSNKRHAKRMEEEIREYLEKEGLTLKDNSAIVDIANEYLDFVGYEFTYGHTKPRRKIVDHIFDADRRLSRGKYTIKKLSSMGSYYGYIKHTNTRRFFNKNLQSNQYTRKKKLSKLVKYDQMCRTVSGQIAKIDGISINMEILRETTEHEEYESFLVRYYPKTQDIKIVFKSSYKYPDVHYDEDEIDPTS